MDLPFSLRFNPLHCGAVVASSVGVVSLLVETLVSIPFIAGQWSLLLYKGPRDSLSPKVSIPFIAGQWSLPAALLTDEAMEEDSCFNPLHCGAVVASGKLATLLDK